MPLLSNCRLKRPVGFYLLSKNPAKTQTPTTAGPADAAALGLCSNCGRDYKHAVYRQTSLQYAAGRRWHLRVEAIERCRADYEIPRVRFEADKIRSQFGDFRPEPAKPARDPTGAVLITVITSARLKPRNGTMATPPALSFADMAESAIPGRYKWIEPGQESFIELLKDHTFRNKEGNVFPMYRGS